MVLRRYLAGHLGLLFEAYETHVLMSSVQLATLVSVPLTLV